LQAVLKQSLRIARRFEPVVEDQFGIGKRTPTDPEITREYRGIIDVDLCHGRRGRQREAYKHQTKELHGIASQAAASSS
jgi:hypothetical protein